MPKYNFKEDTNISGAIYDALDKIHPSDFEKVYEAINQIGEDAKAEKQKKITEWFYTIVVPMLAEIAKGVSGTLDINEGEKEIVASIRSEGGVEVSLGTGRMRMALYLADSISIETIGDETEIALIFIKELLLK